MISTKVSAELRGKYYDPKIAKKYSGFSFRKAKELELSDEMFERMFNIICENQFFNQITPNFTEGIRNVRATLARSSYCDVNRYHGEGTAEECLSFEFIHELLRVLIQDLRSQALIRNAEYKLDGFFCNDMVSDLLKKVTSGNIVIVSPTIGTFMQANGIIGGNAIRPEQMLMETNLPNVFVDSCSVKNSALVFDASKVTFDFTEITMFTEVKRNATNSDPNHIRIEGGVHSRVKLYASEIQETVYELFDVTPRKIAL